MLHYTRVRKKWNERSILLFGIHNNFQWKQRRTNTSVNKFKLIRFEFYRERSREIQSINQPIMHQSETISAVNYPDIRVNADKWKRRNSILAKTSLRDYVIFLFLRAESPFVFRVFFLSKGHGAIEKATKALGESVANVLVFRGKILFRASRIELFMGEFFQTTPVGFETFRTAVLRDSSRK